MLKGPNGEKRPADAIGVAVTLARLATGEVEYLKIPAHRKSGLAGAKARSASLTSEQRSKIAKEVANTRWKR